MQSKVIERNISEEEVIEHFTHLGETKHFTVVFSDDQIALSLVIGQLKVIIQA